MSLVPTRRADDGRAVHPAATIAGTDHYREAGEPGARTPLHHAATGAPAGWQDSATAELVDEAVAAA
ncbi:aldehyde dehydrogenase, partial [Burkholderia sp. Cy-647]|nr:aldehyde dehydrogenase [Burkholderia sp. Cy-647]